MKRILTLSIIIFAFTCAKGDRISIPLEIDELGLPYIKLDIKGVEYKYLFDLGAESGLYLYPDMIKRISGLSKTGAYYTSSDLSGNSFKNYEYNLKNLNIDGMNFKNISVLEITEPWGMSFNGYGIEKEPVIGAGLFNDHTVIIDYKNKVLHVDDKSGAIPELKDSKWMQLPFEIKDNNLTLLITTEYRRYKMKLDTGASLSIIKEALVPEIAPRKKAGHICKGCEMIQIFMYYDTGTIKLSLLALNNLPEYFTDDGLLGVDFFKNFKVLYDISDNKILIKKY